MEHLYIVEPWNKADSSTYKAELPYEYTFDNDYPEEKKSLLRMLFFCIYLYNINILIFFLLELLLLLNSLKIIDHLLQLELSLLNESFKCSCTLTSYTNLISKLQEIPNVNDKILKEYLARLKVYSFLVNHTVQKSSTHNSLQKFLQNEFLANTNNRKSSVPRMYYQQLEIQRNQYVGRLLVNSLLIGEFRRTADKSLTTRICRELTLIDYNILQDCSASLQLMADFLQFYENNKIKTVKIIHLWQSYIIGKSLSFDESYKHLESSTLNGIGLMLEDISNTIHTSRNDINSIFSLPDRIYKCNRDQLTFWNTTLFLSRKSIEDHVYLKIDQKYFSEIYSITRYLSLQGWNDDDYSTSSISVKEEQVNEIRDNIQSSTDDISLSSTEDTSFDMKPLSFEDSSFSENDYSTNTGVNKVVKKENRWLSGKLQRLRELRNEFDAPSTPITENINVENESKKQELKSENNPSSEKDVIVELSQKVSKLKEILESYYKQVKDTHQKEDSSLLISEIENAINGGDINCLSPTNNKPDLEGKQQEENDIINRIQQKQSEEMNIDKDLASKREELSKLNQLLNRKQSEIQNHENLANQISLLDNQIREKQSIKENLENTLSTKQAEILKIDEKITSFRNTVAKHQETLSELERVNETLTRKKNEETLISESLLRKQNEEESISNTIEIKRRELEEFEEESKDRMNSLKETLEKENEKYQELLKNIENTRTEESKISTQNNELSTTNSKLEEIEEQLQSKLDNLSEIEMKHIEALSNLEKLENNIEMKKQEESTISESLSSKQKEIEEFENKIVDLKKSFENQEKELSGKITSLNEDYSQISKELESAKEELESNKKELESIESKLKEKQDEEASSEELNTTISSLESKINDLNSEITEKQDQLTKLNEDISSQEVNEQVISQKIKELEEKLKELEQSITTLKDNESELQNKNSTLEQEETKIQENIKKLEQNCDTLTNNIESKNNELSTIESNIEEHQTKFTSLEKEIETKNQEFIDKEEDYQKLLADIKNLENQKLNLEKQISDLRRELENLESIEKENESNDESVDNLEDILQPEPIDKIYVPLTGGEDSGIIEEGPIKTRSESEWQNWYNFGKGQGLSKEQVDHAINAFDLQDNDGSGEIELDEFFILMSK